MVICQALKKKKKLRKTLALKKSGKHIANHGAYSLPVYTLFHPSVIPRGLKKYLLINNIQRGKCRAVCGFGYFHIFLCDRATGYLTRWVVGACLLLAGLRDHCLWFLVALHILSTQLLCMLSWFSGHFIISLGPFKLISPVPIVEEFGNTMPRDVMEQWMPAGRLCQSWGWSFCPSA